MTEGEDLDEVGPGVLGVGEAGGLTIGRALLGCGNGAREGKAMPALEAGGGRALEGG